MPEAWAFWETDEEDESYASYDGGADMFETTSFSFSLSPDSQPTASDPPPSESVPGLDSRVEALATCLAEGRSTTALRYLDPVEGRKGRVRQSLIGSVRAVSSLKPETLPPSIYRRGPRRAHTVFSFIGNDGATSVQLGIDWEKRGAAWFVTSVSRLIVK